MSTEVHGFCEPQFMPFRDAFAANFDAGLELGASLGVTWRGRLVADLWAGCADVEQTRPWEKDTIVLVASTTKIMVMIAALMVIERGLLDLDAPVARYWPEFAQGGKAAVTVRDALTHQGGVPGFDVPISDDELCDWARATARLAAEPHWFGGERQICYHFHTYGFLIGELIRRVDGRGPRQFLAEEISIKAGADFLIGLTSDAVDRVAALKLPAEAWQGEGILKRMIDSVDMTTMGSWQRLSSEQPGSNGYANGRSIALVGAIIANGGLAGGERLLSPATIALAGREHAYGHDPYLGMMRLGLGFGIDHADFPATTPTSLHWGGYGGSGASMDPACGVSFGYTPNNWTVPEVPEGQLALDQRLVRFFDAFREVVAGI
jgi:CubicO group peptidase (beta-lactamase class C family)